MNIHRGPRYVVLHVTRLIDAGLECDLISFLCVFTFSVPLDSLRDCLTAYSDLAVTSFNQGLIRPKTTASDGTI